MCADDGNVGCCWDDDWRSCGCRAIEGCGTKSIMKAMFARMTPIRMIETVEMLEEMAAKIMAKGCSEQ